MKIILKTFIILLLFCSVLPADDYFVKWINYDYTPFGDYTRGLVYNPHTDHVLVATRLSGSRIIILNAANGDSICMMDSTGISGGTYDLDQIGISDDGKIYVCNLSAPQYTPGSTLKIYKYEDESDAPTVVYDDALDGGRYGDSFAVIGEGANTYIYCSGNTNDKMVVLKDNGSGTLVFDSYITLPQTGNARHGISPLTPGGNIWINGAESGFPPVRMITNTGTLVGTVPDTIMSAAGSSTVTHTVLGQYNTIMVTNAFAATVRSARYYVDALGTVTFDYFGGDSDTMALRSPIGLNPNGNGSASLSYDTRRHAMITLIGNNSIASVGMDSLLKASTPRVGILEISMNEYNEFFPTDLVGESNDREMYLTWSEGKIFFGMIGNTIIDPTLSNYMMVAFDTDPIGQNGTTTPPLVYGNNAGNVSHLPFNADFVYMIEPWDVGGYMIGSIFEWNGSSWIEHLFDGNAASQGALAYADTIEGKVAKFAAIRRNDVPGIGQVLNQPVSMMAYVVEEGTLGNVLCSFPDENPIGNGVGFDYYYYAQQLGSGMFPRNPNHVEIRNDNPNSIDDQNDIRLNSFSLEQNYPNPFNPETKIAYYLPRNAEIEISVFNITGQKIRNIFKGNQKAGNHTTKFNGSELSSGVYFYKLQVQNLGEQVRKLLLIK